MAKPIESHVRLDAKTFRRYCAFDTFRRQRRWFPPVLVGMLLITLALAGLLNIIPMGESAAGVLMGLGIAVPLVVFGLYAIQVEAQIANRKLKEAPEVYALRFADDGVRVADGQNPESSVTLGWDQLWAAFRRRDCVYLYATPDRAFILPNGQANVADEAVWKCLNRNMGEGKCVVSQ